METGGQETGAPNWWAQGLLFENCNCQVMCPAHVSFKQNCTHEKCIGHWALHFAGGAYGDLPLADLNALILFETPQQMYSGNWTQLIYIDERANPAQREALLTILTGRAGGPWPVLARFVGKWLEPRFVPFRMEIEGRRKTLTVDGLFETVVEAVRGTDPEREVIIENLFNQIHGPVHVLAKGSTKYSDRGLVMDTQGTHGVYSNFSWKGP